VSSTLLLDLLAIIENILSLQLNYVRWTITYDFY